MLRRPVAARLVASLLLLTGCAEAVSQASTPAPGAPATNPAVQAASAPAPAPPGPPASPLVQALDATWGATPAGSCVMVSDGPHVVYERNPDLSVVPASTMKLLTATAVLAHLRPDERLRTPVLAAAPPGLDGVVHGDLFLVGGADPVLGTLPWGAHFTRQPRLLTAIEVLADRLVAGGVRHVTGRVVGDDGRHERVRYVPTWPSRYASGHETGPLSSLPVNDGFERWSPTVAFRDPAAGAAGVLNELLRQRGVVVRGLPGSGAFPPGAVELAAVDSPTITELVHQMLLDSDNDTAEVLLRELGLRVHGRGTTDDGRRVVVDTLRAMGLPMDGVVVADGSGLDPANRVTCRLLVALLVAAPTRDLVAAGLPVAAQTGTLYKRFLATPVAGHLRAKTGSIRSVVSLAGNADGVGGRQLTFAYVQNQVGATQGRHLQDRLGHDLVLAAP